MRYACLKQKLRFDAVIDAFLYVFGSAGNCSADRWNRSELEKWRIIPRMLRDATERNLEVCSRSLAVRSHGESWLTRSLR